MAETDTPVTATKAHASGGATSVALLLLFFLGDRIGLAVPPIEDATAAFLAVAESLGGGAIAWLVTFWTRNRPKGDVPHGGGVQAHPLAVLGAAGLAVLLLAGCAGQNERDIISRYCAATTPELRAILRVPLLRVLDLPADTGELVCIGGDMILAEPALE